MFTCEICGEEGFSEPDIRTHLLINHFENEMSCPFCCLSGVTYDELEFHINVAHSEEDGEAADSSERPTKELRLQTVGAVHSSGTSSHLEMDVEPLEGVLSPWETDEMLCTGSLGSHEELNAGTTFSTVPKAHPPAPLQGSSQTVTVKQVSAQDRGGQRESVTPYRELKKPEPCVTGRTVKHGTQSSQFPRQQEASNNNFEEQVKPKQKRLMSPAKGISTEKMYACPMCALVCRDCYILQEHVELHLQESMAEEKTSHSNQQLLRSPEEAEEKWRPEVNLQGIHVLDNNVGSKQPVQNVQKLVSPMIDKSSPPSVKTIASGAPARKLYECPMCALVSTNSHVLQEHVELHLMESSITADNSHSDLFLAKRLQEEEEKQRRAEEAGREAEEFQKLQNQFGLDNSGGYKQQHIRNMERAVSRGQMVPAEFHRRKAEMMESLASGADDGRTRTSGVIGALYGYYQRDGRDVAHVWLCAETDHFHSGGGDKGWGCGYRNFQMLVSSLLKMDQYKDCFKDKTVPCIPKVQALIEDAWKEGADPQGASHFNRKLQGTRAWIGATEIYSMLISLRVKSRILDFHCPTGPSDTHPRLFQWVKDYYSTAMCRGARLPPRVIQTASPPIYLQHQGHSRTIVGIEERKNGNLCLLIFDPGCPSQELQRLLQPDLSGARLKHLRKLPSALKHKQYQIVAVEGTLSQEEKHAWLQNSRILQAEKIP
ncbi:zinc finger-containing ubiquitin peptidase 1 isoform X3 [Polyodon spathula]|uniref:zinc finger-containing ubiquitin peptidase 1 isoform X3 n=1 Tax=Polyodon spathula TaxID=7913 RepID=UPI001B7E20D1|nr:zinc finger-containing ubiquitin peptidase 1 isoform X3 [Polyodon spathula]